MMILILWKSTTRSDLTFGYALLHSALCGRALHREDGFLYTNVVLHICTFVREQYNNRPKSIQV